MEKQGEKEGHAVVGYVVRGPWQPGVHYLSPVRYGAGRGVPGAGLSADASVSVSGLEPPRAACSAPGSERPERPYCYRKVGVVDHWYGLVVSDPGLNSLDSATHWGTNPDHLYVHCRKSDLPRDTGCLQDLQVIGTFLVAQKVVLVPALVA